MVRVVILRRSRRIPRKSVVIAGPPGFLAGEAIWQSAAGNNGVTRLFRCRQSSKGQKTTQLLRNLTDIKEKEERMIFIKNGCSYEVILDDADRYFVNDFANSAMTAFDVNSGELKLTAQVEEGDIVFDSESRACRELVAEFHDNPDSYWELFQEYRNLLGLNGRAKPLFIANSACQSAKTFKDKTLAILEEARRNRWIEIPFADKVIGDLKNDALKIVDRESVKLADPSLNKDVIFANARAVYYHKMSTIIINDQKITADNYCDNLNASTLIHESKHYYDQADIHTIDHEESGYLTQYAYLLRASGNINGDNYIKQLFEDNVTENKNARETLANELVKALEISVGPNETWLSDKLFDFKGEATIAAWYKLKGDQTKFLEHQKKFRESYVNARVVDYLSRLLPVADNNYMSRSEYYDDLFKEYYKLADKTCTESASKLEYKQISCTDGSYAGDYEEAHKTWMILTKLTYLSFLIKSGKNDEAKQYLGNNVWPALIEFIKSVKK